MENLPTNNNAAHSVELIHAHAHAILDLADRFESTARAGGTLDTIEHHTRQIDALLITARARHASDLLVNILKEN